ncbi:hypothetical protein B0T25DRAFT_337754 [Lasiosphaeria hispida]|uniref:Secreted protein n=1 Tax=Lasiosphaeria hispida TaxID=260671 RepID=A0AAJ0H649_9PEZI|nr:hypothetical protein B0T25DRAFT_337754 [Lasiosphaeria hispida]
MSWILILILILIRAVRPPFSLARNEEDAARPFRVTIRPFRFIRGYVSVVLKKRIAVFACVAARHCANGVSLREDPFRERDKELTGKLAVGQWRARWGMNLRCLPVCH